MAYISVDVDIEEYLDEVPTKALEEELANRRERKGKSRNIADYKIPQGQAEYALDQAAQVLRKIERCDLAFKLDEIKVDYVQ